MFIQGTSSKDYGVIICLKEILVIEEGWNPKTMRDKRGDGCTVHLKDGKVYEIKESLKEVREQMLQSSREG